MKPMKAYLNILKLRINMALKRNTLCNYPVVAIIEPTLFCNLRCKVCERVRSGLRPPRAIDWELYKSIIDEIGDYLFELHMYNWGEPLLHKKTPELIQYAKSKGISVILSTNLSMNLSEEYVQNLVRSGLDELIVSLDGATEETYKKYRRGGDFSLVRANMLRIQSAKRALGVNTPIINWQFLVFRHNEHEIEIAKSNYKDWGADQLTLGGALVSQEWYAEGLEPSTIPQHNLCSPENPLAVESKRQLGGKRVCSWLYGVFVLNPNGKVSPCCSIEDEKDDFADYSPSLGFFNAWNSDRFKTARSLLAKSHKHQDSDNITKVKGENRGDRLDGAVVELGRSLKLNDEQLVCQSCPMPSWCRVFMETRIDSIVGNSIVNFWSKSKRQYLIPYMLMLLVSGVPLRKRFAVFVRSVFSRIGSGLK